MATFTGTTGLVKIGSATVAEISSWEVSPGTKDADTTIFGQTWESSQVVLNNWTAKFSGMFDPTDTSGQVALWNAFSGQTTVTVEFDIDGTHHFSGTGWITPSYKTSAGAVATADYSLKGSGALTMA